MIRGLQAGARGYFLKETPVETLLDAIRLAARGEMLIHPETMARLLSRTPSVGPALSSRSQNSQGIGISGSIALMKREKEVLAGVAQGERSKEIAMRLGITERTVRAYLTSIYTKLNVDSRASAVAVALASGLV